MLLIELHPHLGVDAAEVCDFLRALGFSLRRAESDHWGNLPVGVLACRGKLKSEAFLTDSAKCQAQCKNTEPGKIVLDKLRRSVVI